MCKFFFCEIFFRFYFLSNPLQESLLLIYLAFVEVLNIYSQNKFAISAHNLQLNKIV